MRQEKGGGRNIEEGEGEREGKREGMEGKERRERRMEKEGEERLKDMERGGMRKKGVRDM